MESKEFNAKFIKSVTVPGKRHQCAHQSVDRPFSHILSGHSIELCLTCNAYYTNTKISNKFKCLNKEISDLKQQNAIILSNLLEKDKVLNLILTKLDEKKE